MARVNALEVDPDVRRVLVANFEPPQNDAAYSTIEIFCLTAAKASGGLTLGRAAAATARVQDASVRFMRGVELLLSHGFQWDYIANLCGGMLAPQFHDCWREWVALARVQLDPEGWAQQREQEQQLERLRAPAPRAATPPLRQPRAALAAARGDEGAPGWAAQRVLRRPGNAIPADDDTYLRQLRPTREGRTPTVREILAMAARCPRGAPFYTSKSQARELLGNRGQVVGVQINPRQGGGAACFWVNSGIVTINGQPGARDWVLAQVTECTDPSVLTGRNTARRQRHQASLAGPDGLGAVVL